MFWEMKRKIHFWSPFVEPLFSQRRSTKRHSYVVKYECSSFGGSGHTKNDDMVLMKLMPLSMLIRILIKCYENHWYSLSRSSAQFHVDNDFEIQATSWLMPQSTCFPCSVFRCEWVSSSFLLVVDCLVKWQEPCNRRIMIRWRENDDAHFVVDKVLNFAPFHNE